MSQRLMIVAYDIASDDRRSDIAGVLASYGRRIHYSVFEVALGETSLAKLRVKLDGLVHHTEDQVLFFDLGPVDGRAAESVTSLGKPYVMPSKAAIVI
jgi:CRISPR-associated protein Cas2